MRDWGRGVMITHSFILLVRISSQKSKKRPKHPYSLCGFASWEGFIRSLLNCHCLHPGSFTLTGWVLPPVKAPPQGPANAQGPGEGAKSRAHLDRLKPASGMGGGCRTRPPLFTAAELRPPTPGSGGSLNVSAPVSS